IPGGNFVSEVAAPFRLLEGALDRRGTRPTRRLLKRDDVDGPVAVTQVEGVVASSPAPGASPKIVHCPADGHPLPIEPVGIGEQLTHREWSRLSDQRQAENERSIHPSSASPKPLAAS